MYWINYDSIMTSTKNDGTDVKTKLSTNIARSYFAMGFFRRYTYYHTYNQLLIVNKATGYTPTVLYNDTSETTSLFVFNQSGICIIIDILLNNKHLHISTSFKILCFISY